MYRSVQEASSFLANLVPQLVDVDDSVLRLLSEGQVAFGWAELDAADSAGANSTVDVCLFVVLAVLHVFKLVENHIVACCVDYLCHCIRFVISQNK